MEKLVTGIILDIRGIKFQLKQLILTWFSGAPTPTYQAETQNAAGYRVNRNVKKHI